MNIYETKMCDVYEFGAASDTYVAEYILLTLETYYYHHY